jgi:hypothetical protein
MSYYEVFKPHPHIVEYIEHIKERKEAHLTFIDLISETSELKRLISPDLITDVRESSASMYYKYVKKRFKSEEEYPDMETARGMLTYYAYKNYLKYLFKVILGYYGIGSFYYIIFHRLANVLYYRFSQNSPDLWGHEIRKVENRMSEDLATIKAIAKDKADEILLVIFTTMARVCYWLKYTGEGKGEIEAMIDRLSGVKRRKKKTPEEIALERKGESENVPEG